MLVICSLVIAEDGRKDFMLLLEGCQVCLLLKKGNVFFQLKKIMSVVIVTWCFQFIFAKIYFQESTKVAQERALERVRCLEEDLAKLR